MIYTDVERFDGSAWFTYLCTRPLPGTRGSPMGRETGIARCRWGDDGWLYLDSRAGGTLPDVRVAAGLVTYYNRTRFHCLAVMARADGGRRLTILSCASWPEGRLAFPLEEDVALPREGAIPSPIRLPPALRTTRSVFHRSRSRQAMKVLIIGGGYAGMAAAVSLRERAPDAEIVVADARDAHLEITRLHETLRHPLSARQQSFETLAGRLGFRFLHAAAADLGAEALARCEHDGRIALGKGSETFDYLLLTFGASAIVPDGPREHCYTLDDLAEMPGERLLDGFVKRTADDARSRAASVIGAGASGVQFAFELHAALRERDADATVRLVDSDRGTLGAQPDGLDRYARERLAAAGIDFLPGYRFDGQRGGTLRLCATEGDGVRELPSQLCLLTLGRETRPERLEADRHGRVRADGATLERVFAAGDCASYAGGGLDVPTAQAAIRKAKLAAGNIVRAAAGDALSPYDYREVGYFVSLGDGDAVGWLGRHERVLEGLPAAGVKALIEAQYDLLLDGSDTYFDVNALQDKLAALTAAR